MSRLKHLMRRRPPSATGLEIFEIQPVILGGSSTDQANKVLLTREQHIEAVRYWNRVIHDLKSKPRQSNVSEMPG